MNILDLFPVPGQGIEEEHLAFARSVRQWAEREVISRRRELGEDYERLLLPALRTLLLELGLQRHCWPETLGGDGPDPPGAAMIHALALEQVGRADSGLGLIMASVMALAAATAPAAAQDEELKTLLASLFCEQEQELICALVLPLLARGPCPPELQYRGRRLQGEARLEKGGQYTIEGVEMRPLCGGSTAHLFGVVCHVAGSGEPGLFIIPGDHQGIQRGRLIRQTGLAAARNAALAMKGTRVPAGYLVCAGAQALRGLLSWLYLYTSAVGVGALLAAHEILADWVENRIIKGRGQLLRDNPLAASLMADLAQRTCLARLLELDLARLLGDPAQPGDPAGDKLYITASTVVRHVLGSAEEGLNHAMELMGSAGYAREWNLERYWRDIKTLQVLLGSEALQRMEVAEHFYGARPGRE